jgi:hypothetical protein
LFDFGIELPPISGHAFQLKFATNALAIHGHDAGGAPGAMRIFP